MKKVTIKVWAGEGAALLEEAGFKDMQEIPEDYMFSAVRTMFDFGLNVMLYRNKDTGLTTLFVDTKRFTQR